MQTLRERMAECSPAGKIVLTVFLVGYGLVFAMFLVAALVALCGCSLFYGPSDPISDEIQAEWRIAQETLFNNYEVSKAFSVSPEEFRWEAVDGMFKCGKAEKAAGCFSTKTGIKWNKHTPQVIRHEAGHAILWKLKYKDWNCYEHGC